MTTTTQRFFRLLCDLRKLYRIEIIADEKQHDSVIDYTMPTREESTAYLDFLREELSIYSPKTINKLQLDRIVLCKELHKLEQAISGCASMSLFPESLPIRMLFRKNTIYLAVEYCNTMDGRVSIHHELFHAIEAHGEGLPKYVDSVWQNLNPPSFRYKIDASTRDSQKYPLDCDGFLTSYSMEATREDKAELFSHMIVNYARVQEFAAKDKFLRAKVGRLKQIVKTFTAEFDDNFWKNREKTSLSHLATVEYDKLLLAKLQTYA